MSEKKEGTSRRDFLKLSGVAAPAALAAAAAGTAAEAGEVAEAKTSGLQMTPHVKKYMELARF